MRHSMARHPIWIGITLMIALATLAGCSKTADPKTVVIPAGTDVVASLEMGLSTGATRSGDEFRCRTDEAVIVNGETLIPAGVEIDGVVRDVERARPGGRARMTLEYTTLVYPNGKTYQIEAAPLTVQAASDERETIEKIAAGGILGAIIGGIAGGEKGAAIGAGAGAGAGTILTLAGKGDNVELGEGQRLNVRITAATNVRYVAKG